MTNDLLPCPFCQHHAPTLHRLDMVVMCPVCRATGPETPPSYEADPQDLEFRRSEAVRLWNTRAGSKQQATEGFDGKLESEGDSFIINDGTTEGGEDE